MGAGYRMEATTLFLDVRNLFATRYVATVNPLANAASVAAAAQY